MLLLIIVFIAIYFYIQIKNKKRVDNFNEFKEDKKEIDELITLIKSDLLEAVNDLNSIPDGLDIFYKQNHMDTSDEEIKEMKDLVYKHFNLFNSLKAKIILSVNSIQKNKIDDIAKKDTENLYELVNSIGGIYHNISNILLKEDFTGVLKEMYSENKVKCCIDALKYMKLCKIYDTEYESYLASESNHPYIPYLFKTKS
jgi:hypothetical protein